MKPYTGIAKLLYYPFGISIFICLVFFFLLNSYHGILPAFCCFCDKVKVTFSIALQKKSI